MFNVYNLITFLHMQRSLWYIIEVMHDNNMEKRIKMGINRNLGVGGFSFMQSGAPTESLKIQKYYFFVQCKPMS